MILVDIYIPALNDTFDFFLDENTIIEKIIVEINEMISKKVKDVSVNSTENLFLYLLKEKKFLNIKKTLYMCGVEDGSHLILV